MKRKLTKVEYLSVIFWCVRDFNQKTAIPITHLNKMLNRYECNSQFSVPTKSRYAITRTDALNFKFIAISGWILQLNSKDRYLCAYRS